MLNTTQFNMPLSSGKTELGRLVKSADKLRGQFQKIESNKEASLSAQAVEDSNASWATSKGYTEQKRNDLGFSTYSQLKKWHESQETNIARTTQRAAIRKSNPAVKSAVTNAKRRQAAAAKRAASPKPVTPTWNPLKNVRAKAATPMAPKPVPKPKVSRTKAVK